MPQQFKSVWYATPEKVNSMTKLIVFSDRGPLDVFQDRVEYHGKTFAISMPNIVAVSLTAQRIPWVTYLLSNIVGIACFAVIFAVRLNRGVGGTMLWRNLGVIAAILVMGNLIGLLGSTSTKWISVEYKDESNNAQTAYFADGSLLGWGGILGGTSALYRAIQRDDRD